MTVSLAAAGVLVLVQLFVSRLQSALPSSSEVFRSFAGGLGVAYVFGRLLPELAQAATVPDAATGGVLLLLMRHAFLVALGGLLLYYVVLHRAQRRQQRDDTSRSWSFWVNVALYAVFNLFVGYLLVHQVVPGSSELWLFTVALAARFAVGEVSLRGQAPSTYDRRVRWLLAAALLSGWGVAQVVDLGEDVVNLLSAVLAGTIMLSIFQQQLPASGQARPLVFSGACIAFVAVLVLYGASR